MEIFGTRFALTLGALRLRFAVALEETADEPDERPPHEPLVAPPHRCRGVHVTAARPRDGATGAP